MGVTSEPQIIVHDLKLNDKFLTLATQNVWKKLSVEAAGDMLRTFFGKKDQGTTTDVMLGKLRDLGNVFDDTSIIISAF